MPTERTALLIPIIVLSIMLLGITVPPKELVENGNFETGDFSGWTTNTPVWNINSGNDIFGFPVLPPPDGMFAAVTIQGDISSDLLYQDIELPEGSGISCSLTLYYVNFAEDFVIGDGLTIEGENQQFRVDVMDPDADPFDTGEGVLMNLFQTLPGDPSSIGYTPIEFDLSEYSGSTVRIRAAVVTNVGIMFGFIDDVSCKAEPVQRSIPTLSEWGLIATAAILGLASLLALRRRKASA